MDCRGQVARPFGERLQPLSDLQLSVHPVSLHPEHLPSPGTPHADCRTQAEDAGPAIQTDLIGLLNYRALQVKGPSHSSGLMRDKSLSHSTALNQKVKAIQSWR